MSKVPQGICPRQTTPGAKKFLKRLLTRLLRREAKQISDPETDTNPKRRYTGWD